MSRALLLKRNLLLVALAIPGLEGHAAGAKNPKHLVEP
jgi:hypothetical protein